LQFWLSLGVPLVAAVVAWVANEFRKSSVADRERREERYRRILENSRGFYEGAQSAELKSAFLQDMALSWLYCPDSVIRAMYGFIDAVKVGSSTSPEQREVAFQELVLVMRKDLWSVWPIRRTKLRPSDYRLLKST
jgi:hypothetical protein